MTPQVFTKIFKDYTTQLNLLILKSCVAKLTENDETLLKDIAVNVKMDDSKIDQLLIGSNSAQNFVSIKVIGEFVETNIRSQQIIDCYEKFDSSRTREDFLHLVSIYVAIESYGSEEQTKLVSKQQVRDLIIKTIDLDWEVQSILQQKQNDVDVLNLDGFHFYSVKDVNTYYSDMPKTLLVGNYEKIISTCRAIVKFSSNKNVKELTFKNESQRYGRLKELDDLLFSADSIESPTILKERHRINEAPILLNGVFQEDRQSRMSVWDTYLKIWVPVLLYTLNLLPGQMWRCNGKRTCRNGYIIITV